MAKLNLDIEHELALIGCSAMYYDVDGDYIHHILEDAGFTVVDMNNFQQALKTVKQQLEHELWQDNVGKQILGDII